MPSNRALRGSTSLGRRPQFYTAITHGADCNHAIVFTQPASPADPAARDPDCAGTRPAPAAASRAGGKPATAPFPSQSGAISRYRPQRTLSCPAQ